MQSTQHTTLVLNASYESLGVVHWTDAVTMWSNDKCSILEEYDQVIRSAYVTMRIPAVVRLNNYVSKPVKDVKFSRAAIYTRDSYRCQYCGIHCSTNELTYDHVIPRSRGGKTTWENIVSCCYDCNSKKRARTPSEAGMTLRNKPVRPRATPKFEFQFVGRDFPEQWKDYVNDRSYWEDELDE